MKNSFLTALLVLFISSGAFAAPADGVAPKKECPPQLEKEADEAFGKILLYGDFGSRWPTNEQELKHLCSQHKANDKTVRTYARTCSEGITQSIIAILLRGSGKMFKQFCGAKGDKVVFEHAVCGNSDPDHDNECMRKFVQMIKDSMTLPDSTRMAGACCSYNVFESCILNRVRQEPKCTNEAVSFFKVQIKSMAGEALDLTCSEYKNNPALCDGVLKKMKKRKMFGKSLLIPISQVMGSLAY